MTDQPVVQLDNGTDVFFDAWSGGASQAGSFGQITLRFSHPTYGDKRRRYIALDPKPVTHEEMRPFDGQLVKHAIRELGMRSDKGDPDMAAMYACLINTVRMFASAGWSGGFVGYAQAALVKLLDREPLSPLTGNYDEWDYDIPTDANPNRDRRIVAINKRCNRVMKRADGTAFDVEGAGVHLWGEDAGVDYNSREVESFPYEPITLWTRQGPPLEVRYPHEVEAKAVYDSWRDQKGWVSWVDYGNSTKQDEARRIVARRHKEQG